MSRKSCVGTFVAGLAVGAGLGILFAPKSGSETREDLRRIFDEMVRKVKQIKPQEIKEAIQNKIEEIREGLADLDKEKVLAIAKEKAAQLKEKCEELIVYAKEKGIPAIEKTARELKNKTVEVTKNVVAKLES